MIIPNTVSAAWAFPGLMINAQESIKTLLYDQNRIITEICDYFHIQEKELKSISRKSETVYARQIAIYLLREHCRFTFKKTADIFNRDHTTAIHSVKFIKDMLKLSLDYRYKTDIDNLLYKLSKYQ